MPQPDFDLQRTVGRALGCVNGDPEWFKALIEGRGGEARAWRGELLRHTAG